MAYAALASLLQVTEQIMNFDPYFFPCPKNQVESVKENVCSLLTFLDGCLPNCSQTVNDFITKMRDAAYKAEDVFESIIANHFQQKYGIERFGTFELPSHSMEEVTEMIKEIDSIAKEVGKLHDRGVADFKKLTISTHTAVSSSVTKPMETLNDELRIQIFESKLKVVPIVGMGGIGKTTLARSLFDSKYIVETFDVRAWVTVSQEYQVHGIVSRILNDIKVDIRFETGELELRLYKELFGRKYLIVFDDVWETQALDDLKRLFPDNNNSSRIMLTTRQLEVASYDKSVTSCHEMQLLNDDVSWNLFCREAIVQEDCPHELVEIGKEIVKHCQGLPLAISVVGRLLSKENMTREYWEYVAENAKSVLVSNDEQCLGILSLSYNYLPHHLKACFLYLGVFREDKRIKVSTLLELWVAEGFLKPNDSKSVEDVANECLQDLIDRHLILVSDYGSYGKPKNCMVHDLLRDICIREAQKEKFLCVWSRRVKFNYEEANCHRRLSNHIDFRYRLWGEMKDFHDTIPLMSVNRSLISFDFHDEITFGSGLVKVLAHGKEFSRLPGEILDLVNLRYLRMKEVYDFPSSISRLWNLQWLTASLTPHFINTSTLPDEIWEMTQLKHVKVDSGFYFPNIPKDKVRGGIKSCVLKQLQTLSTVVNFRCTEEVLSRMPNLRKLKIKYTSFDGSYCCLNNLVLLGQLVSLNILIKQSCPDETFIQNIGFPNSLRKLKLSGCQIPWESLTIIGKLPNLEVLKLEDESCRGPVWEPNEEEFKKLKFLKIEYPAHGFVEWTAENIHFPSLQHLRLRNCEHLKVFPSGIAEIPTLKVVELEWCTAALCSSARELMGDDEDIKLIIMDDQYSDSDDDDSDDENVRLLCEAFARLPVRRERSLLHNRYGMIL